MYRRGACCYRMTLLSMTGLRVILRSQCLASKAQPKSSQILGEAQPKSSAKPNQVQGMPMKFENGSVSCADSARKA